MAAPDSAPPVSETERKVAFALGFLGAGLAALSLFLPYVDAASTPFGRVAENTMLQSQYGWVNIPILGIWAFGLIRQLISPHRVVWPLLVGVLTVGSALWSGLDETQRTLCPLGQTVIDDACSVAEPGLGIYMLGISGLVLTGAGIFFWRFPARRARVTSGS